MITNELMKSVVVRASCRPLASVSVGLSLIPSIMISLSMEECTAKILQLAEMYEEDLPVIIIYHYTSHAIRTHAHSVLTVYYLCTNSGIKNHATKYHAHDFCVLLASAVFNPRYKLYRVALYNNIISEVVLV